MGWGYVPLEALKAHRRGGQDAVICSLFLRGEAAFPKQLLVTEQVFAVRTGWEILTVFGSNMVPTLAVPTPYGCIGCKLPQPDYSPALITFMFCIMVITIVIDLTGNSLVILAVGKSKKLRNSGKLPILLSIQLAATCNT